MMSPASNPTAPASRLSSQLSSLPPVRALLRPLVVPVFFLASPAVGLAQGGSFGIGTNLELPTTSAYDADHATLAIGPTGDILVAFSSTRTDLAPGALQVECCYMQYLGNSTWAQPETGVSHLVLGAADAEVFGPGFESNRKPDVLAAGDDFFVVWPRANADRSLQRVEGVRISPDGQGGLIVDWAAPGIGFPLDPQVDGASAGIMPDLVEIPGYPLGFGVVYVDDEDQAPPHREYDLRYVRADFSVLPPLIDGPYVLEDGITYDDPVNAGEPNGGKILPDAVRDDSGHLVVAYESYLRTGHQGATANEGRVFTAWYADPGGSQPLRIVNSEFHGNNLSSLVRRPNLATSRLDASNSISLSYLHMADGSALADVGYHDLNFDGIAVGTSNLNYPNLGGTSDSMPVPAHGATIRFCFADRGAFSSPKLMTFLKSVNGRLMQVSTVAKPWRPAVEVLEPAPGDSGSFSFVPLTYEAPRNGNGPLRVYLQISRL